ncbi:SDR family NAD(P)-dependent oxidoreductase [Micromonospora taraxaci]|uniref:SDR family NAD(P)-dependent oxidoreductase n=1 Tax=Micromonospora taraxaci TaxID=1316803 RepID=UPI00340B8CDA
MSKTITVFGAGSGLGSSIAHRFGREGYRVALVARRRAPLDGLAARLRAEGVEADVFTADLTRTAEIPALIGQIMDRFGAIDVVEYAPITTEPFTPATQLDAAKVQHYVNLYLLTPVEIVRAVLPGMLDRGAGGILIGQGVSAVHPMPFMSGVGPAMAAARNYVQTLNGELADQGVYAGVLHVAAMIKGSAGYDAMVSGELPTGMDVAQIPTVHPDDLADTMWAMLTKRDRAEAIVPALGDA